jgi:hypothetical protein
LVTIFLMLEIRATVVNTFFSSVMLAATDRGVMAYFLSFSWSALSGDSGGGGGGGGGGGMGQQIMQMLQGLLKSMGGAGGAGGGGKDGGDSGAQSMGDCSKLPTKQLNGKMGAVSGVADISANMGSGFWNGQNIGPAGPIYGFKLFPSVKACQQACPGVCMGACCNPQQDMMGRVVKFKIPGGSDFRWEGQ